MRSKLSAEEWTALLVYLGPEPTSTPARYEQIRQRIIRLFRWRGGGSPDDLADATFDRVAKLLVEGRAGSAEPEAFVVGVARYVLLEDVKRGRGTVPFEADRHAGTTAEALDGPSIIEQTRDALDECMGSLDDAARSLILGYYAGEGRARIDARGALASAANAGDGTLRVRVHRIRAKLEECVRRRLARAELVDAKNTRNVPAASATLNEPE